MLKLNDVKPPPGLKNGDHISMDEYRRLVNRKITFDNKKDGLDNKNNQKRYRGPKLRTNRRQDYAEFEDVILRVVIHEIPPSQNEWKCWHWATLAEHTATWNALITSLAMSTRARFQNPVVRFDFYFPDHRIRDRKNYESWKPLADGLVRAGVIADDNYTVMDEEKSRVEVDPKNPRTVIVVREVN